MQKLWKDYSAVLHTPALQCPAFPTNRELRNANHFVADVPCNSWWVSVMGLWALEVRDVWSSTAPPFPQRLWGCRTAHSWGRSQHSSPGHTLSGSAQLRLTTPQLSIPPTAPSFAHNLSLSALQNCFTLLQTASCDFSVFSLLSRQTQD